MKNKQKILVFTLLITILFIFKPQLNSSKAENSFHSEEEIQQLKKWFSEDDFDEEAFFLSSNRCEECHGFDTAGIASVNFLGNDINVFDDWQATMMANAAKDPFWRAEVSHEVLLYPQHQEVIESKCTTCHAPMGHYNALHMGQTSYSMAEMLQDTLGLDGVGCLACHKQSPENIGFLNSGHLNFDTAKVAYGPFISPLESPMLMETDYKPVFSTHISDAGLCAGCHTLITETIDYEGNLTGGVFVEQATYHEWLNSDYNTTDVSCQECHFPKLQKSEFFLAAGFETAPRSEFHLHEMAGANISMLKLMKDNIEELGITASPQEFDEVILATENMLKNKTLDIDLISLERTIDTAFFELTLHNKAGHKFPSGYPSRRAFVEFLVMNEFGDTIFISGKTDENFEVFGHDATYESHYNIIREESQVQIYELVMGDVNSDVTTVLLRGDHPLKDNRFPPNGFTTSHSTYDTVLIAGLALEDENFNKDTEGNEGTATDKIYFNIPVDNHNEELFVSAKVYYQTMPPKWMMELFDASTSEIETFRIMFDEADRSPTLVVEEAIEVDEFIVGVSDLSENQKFIQIHNNTNVNIFIKAKEDHTLFISDISGRLLNQEDHSSGEYTISMSNKKGIFIFHFKNKEGISQTEKVFIP